MKQCSRCGLTKASLEFARYGRSKDGMAAWCRPCHKEYSSAWAKKNRKALSEKATLWRAANPQRAQSAQRGYHQRNAEKRAEAYSVWAKENASKRAATTAKRKAAKLRATPPWADLVAIEALYAEARRLQRKTGVRMHVDHIVPLQHEFVCGLHCEANLRVIPGSVNESKRNNWPIEDAQRQGNLFGDAA